MPTIAKLYIAYTFIFDCLLRIFMWLQNRDLKCKHLSNWVKSASGHLGTWETRDLILILVWSLWLLMRGKWLGHGQKHGHPLRNTFFGFFGLFCGTGPSKKLLYTSLSQLLKLKVFHQEVLFALLSTYIQNQTTFLLSPLFLFCLNNRPSVTWIIAILFWLVFLLPFLPSSSLFSIE
jgi:hypothetical protein